jgi:histidinol-phosphate aminotransferase
LRLGYAIAGPALIRRLEQVRPFFPVNALALGAARCLPTLRRAARERIQKISEIRAGFASRLQASGWDVLPSQANFVLVDFGSRARTQEAIGRLLSAGIRTLPPWDDEFSGLPERYLRIVIGSEEEMNGVAEVLNAMK